jgi:release factor glutamine methyltransferase
VRDQTCEFGPITVAFDERVLAPRDWTLLQSNWAVELSASLPDGPILELCAGAGPIGTVVALKTGRPLVQVECDPIAAAFATRNADAAGLCGYEVRVAQLESCVFPGESFPLIIADPPYLRTCDVAAFPEDPPGAIDGGSDGLTYVRQCIAVAATHLATSGALLLQVQGERQARQVGARDVRVHDEDRAVALMTRNEIEGNVIG